MVAVAAVVVDSKAKEVAVAVVDSRDKVKGKVVVEVDPFLVVEVVALPVEVPHLLRPDKLTSLT